MGESAQHGLYSSARFLKLMQAKYVGAGRAYYGNSSLGQSAVTIYSAEVCDPVDVGVQIVPRRQLAATMLQRARGRSVQLPLGNDALRTVGRRSGVPRKLCEGCLGRCTAIAEPALLDCAEAAIEYRPDCGETVQTGFDIGDIVCMRPGNDIVTKLRTNSGP